MIERPGPWHHPPVLVCAGCARHVRLDGGACPFCGHHVGTTRPALPATLALALGIALAACGNGSGKCEGMPFKNPKGECVDSGNETPDDEWDTAAAEYAGPDVDWDGSEVTTTEGWDTSTTTDSTDDWEDTVTTETTDDTTTDDDTTDTGILDEEHDVVRLRLNASSAGPVPFLGTETIVVSVEYGSCLQSFYADSPDHGATGATGIPIFEAWAGALCDPGAYPEAIACDVIGYEQTTDGSTISGLAVTLNVIDAELLEGGQVIIGPVPVDALTGCLPFVEVTADSASGFDAAGDPIWSVESVEGSGSAVPGQANPVDVHVGLE